MVTAKCELPIVELSEARSLEIFSPWEPNSVETYRGPFAILLISLPFHWVHRPSPYGGRDKPPPIRTKGGINRSSTSKRGAIRDMGPRKALEVKIMKVFEEIKVLEFKDEIMMIIFQE